MPRPLKVFLCHAHSDKDTVKALYARLKREGVDVWLDKEKLLPGADWEYEIRKAVRESDVVIVCLSKQFNQAGFRQKEVRIALEEADKKPEGEIFIIPARLEECDNLESLSKWHWVDMFENDGFQRLILALRIRADKIGAALRQRGATTSRQKKNAEQQDAEKAQIENARREKEEQERQKLAKEQADREAAEKAQRETAEKLKRGLAEREANEKIAREKNEREKIELAQAEQAEKEKLEKQKLKPVLQPTPVLEKNRVAPKLNVRTLGVGGIIFASLLIVIFTGNYLLETLVPKQSIDPDAMVTIDATATQVALNANATLIATTNADNTAFAMQTEISLPTFTPTPGGSTLISDGVTMMYIPQGSFSMGSESSSSEKPIHAVLLDAYYIDKYEVTNAALRALC